MSRRIGIFLMAMCMVATVAGAEANVFSPTYYDHRLDSPLYASLPEGMTYMERQEAMLGHFIMYGLTPMQQGGVLLTGSYEHFDQQIEDGIGYVETPPRTEAYAIALDAQGEHLWSMRIGDPQALENTFLGSRIADDQFSLMLSTRNGNVGTHYFIVNAQGQVEDMLSTKALRDMDQLHTLLPCVGGYYAGGYVHSVGASQPMSTEDHLMLLNEDLTIDFSVQNPYDTWAFLFCQGDGVYAQGTDGDVLWAGEVGSFDWDMHAGVARISHSGEVIFAYEGHPDSEGYTGGACFADDGDTLFTSYYDPRVKTEEGALQEGFLCRLNASGELVDVRSYREQWGIDRLHNIHPFGEGYVISGTVAGGIEGAILYVDAQGEAIGMLAMEQLPERARGYVTTRFVQSPEGELYAYGHVQAGVVDDASGTEKRHRENFYTILHPEDFYDKEEAGS